MDRGVCGASRIAPHDAATRTPSQATEAYNGRMTGQWCSKLPSSRFLSFEELNEKQRRWVAGMMSEMLGWGDTKRVAELTGLDPKTIRQGRIDLQNNLDGFYSERIRREGGGRPPLKKKIQISDVI